MTAEQETTPIMTAETETIPEDVQQMAVQFRCCSSDGCIRHDDECGEQGLCIEGRQIARAILADRRRQMPGAIELYRLLKANRKRRYADIAKLIAAHIGGAP